MAKFFAPPTVHRSLAVARDDTNKCAELWKCHPERSEGSVECGRRAMFDCAPDVQRTRHMRESVYWIEAAPPSERREPLTGKIDAEVAIVGGGMAGLSAAQWVVENAPTVSVAVVESEFCGAGATGRSSGFVTPDSELQVDALTRRFGEADARRMWLAAAGGCNQIRRTIDQLRIDCDLVDADSLFIARKSGGWKPVREEHQARRQAGFESTLYDRDGIRRIIGSSQFHGGVRYGGTFGINGCAYVQGLRDGLRDRGVRIFESSPVTRLEANSVVTPRGRVDAEKILICTDRFAEDLGVEKNDVYHVQTALILSEPLEADRFASIFPDGPLLVWDTDLIYQYFRPADGNRLLAGGGLLSRTYARQANHDLDIPNHLRSYLDSKFPQLQRIRFTNWWPGLIGITRDLLPIAGQSSKHASHYVALCAAGLPWSVISGRTAAQVALEGSAPLAEFFRPGRTFTEFDPLQPVLTKPPTFAISNYHAKTRLRGTAEEVQRRARKMLWSLATAIAVGITLIIRGNKKAARRRPF
jgi:gamma-glutamylputrescine oxidase